MTRKITIGEKELEERIAREVQKALDAQRAQQERAQTQADMGELDALRKKYDTAQRTIAVLTPLLAAHDEGTISHLLQGRRLQNLCRQLNITLSDSSLQSRAVVLDKLHHYGQNYEDIRQSNRFVFDNYVESNPEKAEVVNAGLYEIQKGLLAVKPQIIEYMQLVAQNNRYNGGQNRQRLTELNTEISDAFFRFFEKYNTKSSSDLESLNCKILLYTFAYALQLRPFVGGQTIDIDNKFLLSNALMDPRKDEQIMIGKIALILSSVLSS